MTNTTTTGWIAVDLDGTLASYDPRHGIEQVGKALPDMISRVKQWLQAHYEVRVFTARAADETLIAPVQEWLGANGLPALAVTNQRDRHLLQIWDDRAIQVETNTGEVITPRQYISLDLGGGWIGVELDGTLALCESPQSMSRIGEPVSKMRMRVQQWLMVGIDVRLFTARAADEKQIPLIEAWLKEHRMAGMKITDRKDFGMSQFWDDRAVHVVSNRGEIAGQIDGNTLKPKFS